MTEPAPFRLEFAGELWYWRGPSPYHLVTVPGDGSAQLRAPVRDVVRTAEALDLGDWVDMELGIRG